VSWGRRSWDTSQGKYKLRRIIVRYMSRGKGPVHVDDLLRYLQSQGYHPTSTRMILGQFVDVDDEGHVTLI
jgi:hypothetical protein